MKTTWTIELSIILLLALTVRAQNTNGSTVCVTNPPDFLHLSYEAASVEVNLEVNSILVTGAKRVCGGYVTNLLAQLERSQLSNGHRTLAIYLLGNTAATNMDAIRYLIENIDFRTEKLEPRLRLPAWSEYPARDALVRIGTPAADPVLQQLRTEEKGLRRSLMCDVLRRDRVLGREAAMREIRQRIETESDSTRKARLLLALKQFE